MEMFHDEMPTATAEQQTAMVDTFAQGTEEYVRASRLWQ